MRLLITRPAPDADELAVVLSARGHAVFRDPLLEIRSRPGATLSLDSVTGLVFTSANGVRAFSALCARRDFPVYAVGDRTAHAARESGFLKILSANGDVSALAAAIIAARHADQGRLLHVTGSVTAGDLAATLRDARHEVVSVALYEAVPTTTFLPQTRNLLSAGGIDGVLLFSPRTARHWMVLAQEAGLTNAVTRLNHWCLSEAVAEALGSGDDRLIRVAARPTQAALIDAIEREAT